MSKNLKRRIEKLEQVGVPAFQTKLRALARKMGGSEEEYPGVGEELDHIRVRFTWKGQEYEAKFDEFDGNSEPIPESMRQAKKPVGTARRR